MKIVTIGDSYSAAFNTVQKKLKDVSYHDLLIKLLNKNNISTTGSSKHQAISGEITVESLLKIGVDKKEIESYRFLNAKRQNQLDNREISKEEIKTNKEEIKTADVVCVTGGGNEFLNLLNIFGVALKKNLNKDGNGSLDINWVEVIKSLYTVLKSNQDNDSFSIVSFTNFENKTIEINDDLGFEQLINELEDVKKDILLLETKIKLINPDVQIIRVVYPFIWNDLELFSEFKNKYADLEYIYNEVVKYLFNDLQETKLITIDDLVSNDDKLSYYDNFPNVFDLHPSFIGHYKISLKIVKEITNIHMNNQLKNLEEVYTFKYILRLKAKKIQRGIVIKVINCINRSDITNLNWYENLLLKFVFRDKTLHKITKDIKLNNKKKTIS